MIKTKCPGCKASFENYDGPTHAYLGASAGCWKAYGEVLAKEYSDLEYAKVHRLTVDAYSVQHPGMEERRTINSLNIHLIACTLRWTKALSRRASPICWGRSKMPV